MDMYKKSHGKHGYVSVQGDPFHEDTETILKTARFNREAGPNIMAKVPVLPMDLKHWYPGEGTSADQRNRGAFCSSGY